MGLPASDPFSSVARFLSVFIRVNPRLMLFHPSFWRAATGGRHDKYSGSCTCGNAMLVAAEIQPARVKQQYPSLLRQLHARRRHEKATRTANETQHSDPKSAGSL